MTNNTPASPSDIAALKQRYALLHEEWTTHKHQYLQQLTSIDSKHLSIDHKRLSLEAQSVALDKKSPAEREALLAQERNLAAEVDAEAMGVELKDIREDDG